jgi:hypothetical protein
MRNNASYGSSTSLSQQLALSSRWLRQVLLDSMSQPWSRETIGLIETIRVSMAGCGQLVERQRAGEFFANWEGRSMLGKNTIGKAMEKEDLEALHHLGKP